MEQDHLTLAREMLDFVNLQTYDIETKGNDGKIFFITHEGKRLYEVWEVSGIWSTSQIDGTLIKKHEDFYFALKQLILILIGEEMNKKFNQEETF